MQAEYLTLVRLRTPHYYVAEFADHIDLKGANIMKNILPLLVSSLAMLSACVEGGGANASLTYKDSGGITDPSVASVEELEELCEQGIPETVLLDVVFPAEEAGCDWGQNGNLQMAQGRVTGRSEQVVQVELPQTGVICDLGFAFDTIDPSFSQQQQFVYDDNFFLTFNDVVLAASYGPMVTELFENDRGLYRYDWDRLKGYEFGFGGAPTYCIGADEGLSECNIPPPETNGLMSLAFGGELVRRLSYVAVEENRFEFMLATVGDNDPQSDCSHEAFGFQIEVTYVPAP